MKERIQQSEQLTQQRLGQSEASIKRIEALFEAQASRMDMFMKSCMAGQLPQGGATIQPPVQVPSELTGSMQRPVELRKSSERPTPYDDPNKERGIKRTNERSRSPAMDMGTDETGTTREG